MVEETTENEQDFEKLYESKYAIEDVYTSFNKLDDDENSESLQIRNEEIETNNSNQNSLTLELLMKENENKTKISYSKNSKLEEILKSNKKNDNKKPAILITDDLEDYGDTL